MNLKQAFEYCEEKYHDLLFRQRVGKTIYFENVPHLDGLLVKVKPDGLYISDDIYGFSYEKQGYIEKIEIMDHEEYETIKIDKPTIFDLIAAKTYQKHKTDGYTFEWRKIMLDKYFVEKGLKTPEPITIDICLPRKIPVLDINLFKDDVKL